MTVEQRRNYIWSGWTVRFYYRHDRDFSVNFCVEGKALISIRVYGASQTVHVWGSIDDSPTGWFGWADCPEINPDDARLLCLSVFQYGAPVEPLIDYVCERMGWNADLTGLDELAEYSVSTT